MLLRRLPLGKLAPATLRVLGGGGQADATRDAGTLQPRPAQQGSLSTVTQLRLSPVNPSSSFQTRACLSAPRHEHKPRGVGGDVLSRFTPSHRQRRRTQEPDSFTQWPPGNAVPAFPGCLRTSSSSCARPLPSSFPGNEEASAVCGMLPLEPAPSAWQRTGSVCKNPKSR